MGDAVSSLQSLIESGESAFDVVFIDADKARYVDYLELSLALSRPGTVILADNLIRHGLVLDESTTDESARGASAMNTLSSNGNPSACDHSLVGQLQFTGAGDGGEENGFLYRERRFASFPFADNARAHHGSGRLGSLVLGDWRLDGAVGVAADEEGNRWHNGIQAEFRS